MKVFSWHPTKIKKEMKSILSNWTRKSSENLLTLTLIRNRILKKDKGLNQELKKLTLRILGETFRSNKMIFS